MTRYFIKRVDGNPYIKILHTSRGYELWWENNFQCMIYPYSFKSYKDAEKALYKEYGEKNIIKLTEEN